MDFNDYYELFGKKHIYKSIEYQDLIDLLDSLDTGFVYIGGTWCNNCQPVVGIVNDLAIEAGVDVIYNYDPKHINVFGDLEDIRSCSSLESQLAYYQLVEKIGYESSEMVLDTLIPLMHVPFFLGIRNGVCTGYYSVELEGDEGNLHYPGQTTDMTEEFKEKIKSLLQQVIQG